MSNNSIHNHKHDFNVDAVVAYTPQKEDSCKSDACCCSCSHAHGHDEKLNKRPLIISVILLAIGLLLDKTTLGASIPNFVSVIIYILAYIPVGWPVLKSAYTAMAKENDFFNEFSLMGLATIGAMAIQQYPEAIAVMLFYAIGEYFQGKAVGKATKNIEALLDVRVDEALLITASGVKSVLAEQVKVGSTIQVRVGDKIPLDGVLISDKASFNSVALTGESVPQTKQRGEQVLAGMINLDKVIEIETTKAYNDTALAKILELVQEATDRKSKTELLIRRIAKVYTPIVFFLALLLVVLPYFFVTDYIFATWLYRSLTFLVISCPCALVISIPLSYFAGIGAASKAGILFKGANYLDIMSQVNTIVMDKTGTMTEGIFDVQEILYATDHIDKENFISLLTAVESFSSHPIAKAINRYKEPNHAMVSEIKDLKEVAGHGLQCTYRGAEVLVGNSKLLDQYGVEYQLNLNELVGTTILMSINGQYQGTVLIADKIKADATLAVSSFHASGIKQVVMLSGDNTLITEKIGKQIGVDKAIGGLLPNEKVGHIEELKNDPANVICFVGDGINDAPALAISDVGVAMGAMGSDAAIEIADVVIQTDQPSKINTAIQISKLTKKIVYQNIVLAFGIKLGVLALGALGVANMWEAVIADVGVTLLAVANAIRVLSYKEK